MNIRTRNRLALQRSHGFTLIEILVASTVAMAMMVLLASVMNHAIEAWSANDRQSHLREQARQAAEMIRADLQQARIGFDPSHSPGLQLIQNPAGIDAKYLNNDALFWQIPATGRDSREDRLAAVGYFVKREGDRFLLCRLYIPASNSAIFRVYDDEDWISSTIDQAASANAAGNYQGLFLENAPGIWIRCYRKNSLGMEELYIPNTRVDRVLPERVEVSIAFVAPRGMARLGGDFGMDDMEKLLQDAEDAKDFTLRLPENLRIFSGYVKIDIPLAGRIYIP